MKTIGTQAPGQQLIATVFLAATPSAFDLPSALLAPHAQHPVIVHFPIALFIASAIFDLLALWRKLPVLGAVAYFNLLGATISLPFTIGTGLAAWRWQLEGAALQGNLLLHLSFAIATAVVILLLFAIRCRLRISGRSPRAAYVVLMMTGLMLITVTGHIGGILSGVEAP